MDRQLIKEAALRAGLAPDEEMIRGLEFFIRRLKEENRRFNLTAITDDQDIAVLHLEDSWRAVPHIPQDARLVDLGTGAGFPGLVLRLVRPDLDVTL
ncbi:MAG: 16S rRNA (guanine(527)-N(7))-methyltransferase RsmG, partial [Clostridiaceae bacterium]|nr:16S rRNA (guanine(527)-N(7))-methyltransferase RsmG [Clostridiaceae bacterium]